MNKTHQQSLRKASHTTDCGCNHCSKGKNILPEFVQGKRYGKGRHAHIGDPLPPGLIYQRDPRPKYALLPDIDKDIVDYVLIQERDITDTLEQTVFVALFRDGWNAEKFKKDSGRPKDVVDRYKTWIGDVKWLAKQ